MRVSSSFIYTSQPSCTKSFVSFWYEFRGMRQNSCNAFSSIVISVWAAGSFALSEMISQKKFSSLLTGTTEARPPFSNLCSTLALLEIQIGTLLQQTIRSLLALIVDIPSPRWALYYKGTSLSLFLDSFTTPLATCWPPSGMAMSLCGGGGNRNWKLVTEYARI